MSWRRKIEIELLLSDRHRQWGYDVPMADIDFLVVEYDRAIPVALVEYKHVKADLENTSSATYRALTTLADRGLIPFFIVRWESDFSRFQVSGENEIARKVLKRTGRTRLVLDENGYVKFLYWLRNRKEMS